MTTRRRWTPWPGTRCSMRRPRRRPSCATSTCWRCMRRAAPWPKPAGSTSCCACARGDELLGACPLYLKSHSYGEYVFDWAWADAYQRHGLRYYPKLLCAVPFTPVPGSRLLARDAASRRLLLQRAAADLRSAASCRRRTCCSWTTPTARPRPTRAGCCARRCSSTGSTAGRRLCRLRRVPGQPAARQAQEDRAGTPPRGRSRRHLHGARRRADRQRRCGTSSTAATR